MKPPRILNVRAPALLTSPVLNVNMLGCFVGYMSQLWPIASSRLCAQMTWGVSKNEYEYFRLHLDFVTAHMKCF